MTTITEKEFDEQMQFILSNLPDEFKSFVSSYAYEKGHSGGYDEVIIYARNITNELIEPIKKYTATVQAATRKAFQIVH